MTARSTTAFHLFATLGHDAQGHLRAPELVVLATLPCSALLGKSHLTESLVELLETRTLHHAAFGALLGLETLLQGAAFLHQLVSLLDELVSKALLLFLVAFADASDTTTTTFHGSLQRTTSVLL